MNFPWRAEEKGDYTKDFAPGARPSQPCRPAVGWGERFPRSARRMLAALGARRVPLSPSFRNAAGVSKHGVSTGTLPGRARSSPRIPQRYSLQPPSSSSPQTVLTRQPPRAKLVGRVNSPRRRRASGAQRPDSGPAEMIMSSVGPLAEAIG